MVQRGAQVGKARGAGQRPLLCVGNVSAYVEAGESMVERMRTISARWVGDMCWVMWTMESMATSGLAWTKLGGRKKMRSDHLVTDWGRALFLVWKQMFVLDVYTQLLLGT